MNEAVSLRDVFCIHRTAQGDAAALQGTTLDVLEGELLCILGPSGAGKSTLLRTVAGIQPPSAGTVRVLGCDVGRMTAFARARLRNQSLGFLGQYAHESLSPDLAAGESVSMALALRGVRRRARLARVDELLEPAGLKGLAGALPAELSGGERQRFALCAALAHRPALLLADEPTGELDGASAHAVRRLIADLARREGTSVIIVSHDPETAKIADRTVRIRDGRVVEDRRHGEDALVVGRGGWVALPSELLERVGIRDRVRVEPAASGLVLTPASSSSPAPTPPQRSPSGGERWRPARVSLRAVTRSYKQGRVERHVLSTLTHTFTPGRMTALVGPSGSGKTTLLRLLAGLDQPDGGELELDGQALWECDREQLATLRRGRVGYLPQEPSPVGFLSALENVVLVLRIRGWAAADASERAAVSLARLGLADRAPQRVARLSAGEAQRVALARALASARGLLLVDEPTSRLDEANAFTVAGLLAAAATEDGQTVVCATHDPEVIRQAHEVLGLPV